MDISWEFTVIDYVLILAVIMVIILFFVVRYFVKKSATEEIDKKFVQERWKKIEELLSYGKEMNFKLAVIEADKLLDHVLKSMYFPGGNMAERLKIATYKFPKLKQVWWAHKVRNHIVHDAHYALSSGETKKVIQLFRRALKELKCL